MAHRVARRARHRSRVTVARGPTLLLLECPPGPRSLDAVACGSQAGTSGVELGALPPVNMNLTASPADSGREKW